MPTSGTHVTIVQRLASEPAYTALLGNPDPMLDEADPEAIKMRFACLGAVGPDIFYALADYGGDMQDLENVLVKIGGTFSCVGELLGKVDRYVSGIENEITMDVVKSINETTQLVSAAMNESVLALVASGVNLWPALEPARQRDLPREQWFWADYFHYIRSGQFASTLLRRSQGNAFHHAYALGYLTHYVTDVVGHPYVNQVVGAPWRLAWQRHHLVENFMDAYVWDRWHSSLPEPAPPSVEEQPLDQLVMKPNTLGKGAPMTFARINDWINIGSTAGRDPVDMIVEDVCSKIEKGLFDIGAVDKIDPTPPADADFVAWTQFMAESIAEAYKGTVTPTNLMFNYIGGGPARADGLPTAGDVAGAYGIYRLIMRISTEEKISEPQPPDIVADIAAEVKAMLDQVAADLAGIPAPPSLPMGGPFNMDEFLKDLMNAANWAGQVADAVFKAVGDFLAGTVIAGAAIPVADSIKYSLYFLSKALFAVYRALRDVLVLQAYTLPYTDEISGMFGPVDAELLWRSPENAAAPVTYPHEELLAERAYFGSSYSPASPLTSAAEKPALARAAPYSATAVVGAPAGTFTRTLPDDFIEPPLGPDDMFRAGGPQPTNEGGAVSIAGARNFGGTLANLRKGIDLVEAGAFANENLPDYNLDGDRGYAWPCWDVSPAGDPLAPDAPANVMAGGVTVNAVLAT